MPDASSRLLAAALALCLFATCAQEAPAPPPHIFLVTIDTLRADHLGCYGYERDVSPTLDALAERGVLFENAFAVMPTTVPSHASLFFSTWPVVHGSTSNFLNIGDAPLSYLPELLRESGYATGAFVSMQALGRALSKFDGFDTFFFPEEVKLSSEVVLTEAREWLRAPERDARKPVFMWLHLWDPHHPYRLHPDLMETIQPGFESGGLEDEERQLNCFVEPADAYGPEALGKMIDLYDNEIAHVDRELGRFLDDLQSAGFIENALIIVTSDHGESLDELYASYGYAFDHGEFLFDHQTQVPLIVAGPQVAHPGDRFEALTSLVDLAPTLLDLVGSPVPEAMHGISRAGQILGSRTPGPRESLVYLQRRRAKTFQRAYLEGDQFGVRGRQYKLLHNTVGDAYELRRNGGEELVEAEEIAEELRERLSTWRGVTQDFAEGKRVAEDVAAGLRQIGYVD